jgi:deazaflavin-dependent oxidoreductase (nitroreductase family)
MYLRPTKLVQISNRIASWFAARGLMPAKTVQVELKGRRSGEMRTVVINSVEHEGQRYFVSTRGESEWVRNVRAAGGEVVIVRGGRKRARLEELPAEQRAPIIKKYLGENALVTRRQFGLDPKAELSEFEAIAADHPVFRIEMPE